MGSAPPFFVPLAAGLLIAFALQLLLTSFGVAIGVTALRFLKRPSPSPEAITETEPPSRTSSPIGLALGTATLLSVNTVLVAACYLAVKLSLVDSPIVGGVLGVVIWSAYLLVLVWVSSSAVGVALGSLFGIVNTGWKGARAIVQSLFRQSTPSPEDPFRSQITAEISSLQETQQQLLQLLQAAQVERATVLAAVSQQAIPVPPPPAPLPEAPEPSASSRSIAIKQLIQVVRDRVDLPDLDVAQLLPLLLKPISAAVLQQSRLQLQPILVDYLHQTKKSDLKLKSIQKHLTDLFESANSAADGFLEQLQQIDRATLLESLKTRQDLSRKEINRILHRFEVARDRLIAETRDRLAETTDAVEPTPASPTIVDRVRSIDPQTLDLEYLGNEFQQVMEQMNLSSSFDLSTLVKQIDWQTLVDQLQETGELTGEQAKKLFEQLQQLAQRLAEEPQHWLMQTQRSASSQITTAAESIGSAMTQQIEQIQQDIQTKTQMIRQQTQQQLESVRSTTEAAVWWLFMIALTSLASSAIAGTLSVTGLPTW